MPQELKTLSEYEELIKSDKITIVDFWASWCGPCINIAPWFIEQSEKYPKINFAKVDVDVNSEASESAGIACMPTFKVFKSGELINTIEGADKTKLEEMFKLDDAGIEALQKEQEEEKAKKEKIEKALPMVKTTTEYDNFINNKERVTLVNFYVDGYNDKTSGLLDTLHKASEDDANKNISSENCMRCDLNEHGQLGNHLKIRSLPHLRVNFNGELVKIIDDNVALSEIEELVKKPKEDIQKAIDDRKADEARLAALVPQLDEEAAYMDAIKEESAALVVVDYYATWCGPCIRFAPTFIKMADEYKDKNVKFYKIDCDKNTAAKKHADVKCFPTFKLWKAGKKVDEMEGAGEKALKDLIEKNLA